MEGEFDFMNFNFIQEENIYEVLPFGNWSHSQNDNHSENFFNFLKIDYNTSPLTEKKSLHSEEIIEKINEVEKKYSNIIHKNLLSSPTISINSSNF